MNSNNIEVTVLVDGSPIKQYGHEGRTFVMAKDGCEYAVRIKNNNPFRVMAVISVDGLNAITGKPASQTDDGYVLQAYSSYSVTGYRKDMNTTAAFKFTRKHKSYASTKGNGGNEGVIAVAVWAEKEKPQPVVAEKIIKEKEYVPCYPPHNPWQDPWRWPYRPTIIYRSTGTGDTWLSAQNSMGSTSSDHTKSAIRCYNMSVQNAPTEDTFQAGTTWGQKLDDRVVSTTFDRASSPLTVMEIFYAFRHGLESLGIDLDKPAKVSVPTGFPSGFATPPEGWNG